MTDEPKRLRGSVTTVEVAEAFGVNVPTVVTWINDGKLKAEKGDNGRWYVSRQSMVEYARERFKDE